MTNPPIEQKVKELAERYFDKGSPSGVSRKFKTSIELVRDIHGFFIESALSLYNQGQMDALGGLRVSWDIADNGKEWIVQFWRKDLDGTMTLVTQLDKNSDDGGSFDLSHIASLKEQTHAQI